MKYLAILLLLVCGCSRQELDAAKRIKKLETANAILNNTITDLSSRIYEEQVKTAEYKRIADTYSSGKEPLYVVTFQMSESHFSLDPMTHLKDHMNAVTFNMPVSKVFYDQVKPGTNVVNSFRAGSFWFKGSLGDWELTVVSKAIH